jgi:AcrR family transcriptional regulator
MPRPRLRTPELAERILVAAAALLERDGPAALTARAVAASAGTSTAAVYELFGDKGGLVRALYFDGFRRLAAALDAVPETADPRADVEAVIARHRAFASESPVLVEVLFSRPFTHFAPGPSELEATRAARDAVVRRVRRWLPAGTARERVDDTALVLITAANGLVAAERAGIFGTRRASRDRRWRLAVEALLTGLTSA